MSTIIHTQQCFPKPISFGSINLPAPDPDHEHCPGGQHTPGVIGGWHCPCVCHNKYIESREDLMIETCLNLTEKILRDKEHPMRPAIIRLIRREG